MGAGKNLEVRLNSRPDGLPRPSDFELVESEIPSPGSGEVLVRNLTMSVDPYMRGRMADRASYAPPFQLGETLQGGAVGRIEASNGNAKLKQGDIVLSQNGWRTWFVSDGMDLTKIDPAKMPSRPDGTKVGVEAYLGALGMPGLTAYVGLKRIGQLKKDDRVLVSAAAGAVGSLVCQMARNTGCEIVVGSAGSAEKCAYLTNDLGVTAAINYREAGDLSAAVAEAMPGGIDLYFENVGGAHLEAALANMRLGGRIVVCGMIDLYNESAPPPGPRNIVLVLARRLKMQGFLVFDHFDLMEQFLDDMGEWIAAGKITWRQTVVDGLERAPGALIGLFLGENTGKMLVRLAEDEG